MNAVQIVGLVCCALGAVLHGYICWLESVAWTGLRARRIFGLSEADARTTAPLALNQGFYNLFLAVEVVAGIVLVAAGLTTAGITAIVIGAGSMVAAGVVLVVSSPDRARAAVVQASAPLLGLLLLLVGVVVH